MLLKQEIFKSSSRPQPIRHCQWPQLRFHPGLPPQSLPQTQGAESGGLWPPVLLGVARKWLGGQPATSTPGVFLASPAPSPRQGMGREVGEGKGTLSCSQQCQRWNRGLV